MEYKELDHEFLDQILEIYSENGWSAYTENPAKLKKAFENSLFILGAFENNNLIGFIRCVGDGVHVVFIQDLILRPKFFRKGIGTSLLNKTIKKFSQVRTILLITDKDDPVSNKFYKKVGMKNSLKGFPINTYFY